MCLEWSINLFKIVGDVVISIKELAELIIRLTGSRSEIVHLPTLISFVFVIFLNVFSEISENASK